MRLLMPTLMPLLMACQATPQPTPTRPQPPARPQPVTTTDITMEKLDTAPPSHPPGEHPVPGQRRKVAAGALDPNLIRRVVQEHKTRFKACYEQHPPVEGEGLGLPHVVFEVGPDGKVVGADVNGTGIQALDACLERTLSKMRFPEQTGRVRITYPMR